MGYATFAGGRVSRSPMRSEFKEQARRALFDRLYAQFPQVDWLELWSEYACWGGFYYAYGLLSQVARDYNN